MTKLSNKLFLKVITIKFAYYTINIFFNDVSLEIALKTNCVFADDLFDGQAFQWFFFVLQDFYKFFCFYCFFNINLMEVNRDFMIIILLIIYDFFKTLNHKESSYNWFNDKDSILTRRKNFLVPLIKTIQILV
jgi:hypothetical protein